MAINVPKPDAPDLSRGKTMGEQKDENDANEDLSYVPDDTANDVPNPNNSQSETVGESSDISYVEQDGAAKVEDMFGSPSLFNKAALFVHPLSYESNGFKKYSDRRGEDKIYSTSVPENREIIDKLKNDEKRRLHYADFAFSKYDGIIPNNRLIVLRRFPFPTFNNLSFAGAENDGKVVKPIAKAITHFGGETGNEISEILKIAGYKNYKELTAELDFIQGVDKGASDSPFFSNLGGRTQSGLKAFSALSGRGDISGRKKDSVDQMLGKNWENDRRGPENVIHKTHIADVGVGANLEFQLTFNYKLRSYNNVNPRVALMDLISNLMTLVHTNAEFWGGQNVVLPNHQKFPFIGNEDAFYSGDYGTYLSSVVDWFSEPFASGGSFQGLLDGIMSGDFSSLGALLGKVGGAALDLQSSKSRSSVIGLKTLLDANPVGNHHITIGNPLNPWASIGNLIVPSFNLSFENELGHHDMPTGVKLEVDIKTATPLDSTGVQGIFANGIVSNRMYMKPSAFIDATGITKQGGNGYTADDISRMEGFIF